jgi:hypothetical protein
VKITREWVIWAVDLTIMFSHALLLIVVEQESGKRSSRAEYYEFSKVLHSWKTK